MSVSCAISPSPHTLNHVVYMHDNTPEEKKKHPPELGIYIPHSSARVNESALSLSPRSCHEPRSNSQLLGHEPLGHRAT